MCGYDSYTLYNALKLHFNSDYDYFKYNGKLNLKRSTYDSCRGKYFYEKLGKKYSTNLREFYVANMLVNPKMWVQEMLDSEAEECFWNYQKRHQSLSYILKDDINRVCDLVSKFDDLFKIESGYPLLLRKVYSNDITLESFLILNKVLGFIPRWNKKFENDLLWKEFELKCRKYVPFLQFEESLGREILVERVRSIFM